MQKKNVIQYPCFTKLIIAIANLMEKTPRATTTPNPDVVQKKRKGKQVAGESSSLKPSLKKRIRGGCGKLVEGEYESDGDEFADTKDDDDKHVDAYDDKDDHDDNDDDDDDNDDHSLIRTRRMGSLEIRTENMAKWRKLTIFTTNDLMKETLPILVTDAINKVKSDLPSQVAYPELWNALKAKYEKYHTSTDSCRKKTSKSSKSARGSSSKQPVNETNTSASEQPQQQNLDAWVDIPEIDEDEVILEEETPELIDEFQNVDKQVPTIYDHERMKATIRDMPSNQFIDPEEYAYHLEQAHKFIENQVVWENRQEDVKRPYKDLFFLKNRNTEEKRYMLSLHKIHATSFLEKVLEEKMIRWIKHIKVRDDPKELFSNHKIVEIVKVITEQQYELDFMERVIVMRENDKSDSFSKTDFKYLNKNDIKDMYYLCLNNKNYRENKLLNSLLTFIRICVIWERDHDFQLGIKSYQVKINLTPPTLTFLGIKACNPYSIVDKRTIGLIYLNNKEEKRIMDLVDIAKFCDATLEKVFVK
ncbi:hypothetical protein Tco_0392833 [Tanacetum coccineum]